MPTIATKPYNIGDQIFECKPIIHCIEETAKGKHCDYCLERSDSLKKCSKCSQMQYCGKDCQHNDWNHHKNECKFFRHPNFKVGSLAERLLLRLWLCVKSDPSFVTKTYETYDGKEICLNDVRGDPKDIFKNQIIYAFFTKICVNFDNYGLIYDRKQLLNWYTLVIPGGYTLDLRHYTDNPSRISYSSFDPVHSIVGSGIFIQLPHLSHSCLPNANIVTNGPHIQYRAIKPIDSGNEIAAAIVDLAADKRYRNEMLGLSFIRCNCDKCQNNLDQHIDYRDYNRLWTECTHNWQLMDQPIKAHMANKNYTINWDLILFMRAIYGEYHAQISEAMVLSFICFAMYSKKSSKTLIYLWYNTIEPSVRVTHGSNHPLYKLFRNVYKKFNSNFK